MTIMYKYDVDNSGTGDTANSLAVLYGRYPASAGQTLQQTKHRCLYWISQLQVDGQCITTARIWMILSDKTA